MKRRLLCALLALLVAAAMLPTAVVEAKAAAQMTSSEALISCIKEYEGFRAQAYLSGGQWSIGYGTSASPGDTVTVEEADQALRAHLHSLEKSLNGFIAKYGLELSQNQFDALACFTYNCGVAWMSQSGRFRDAVIHGASEEQFLFAISLWANNGSIPDAGLLKRRLAEAEMYLNGSYLQKSSQYTYTIFDANGGTPGSNGEDKMQGYRAGSATQILVKDPVLPGSEFAGWYTTKDGGAKVTVLNSATAGKTLYAHYKSNGSIGRDPENGSAADESSSVIATGTVKCTTYVNIRKGAGTGNALVGRAYNGTKVEIYETTTVGAYRWGRISSGWICMDYVVLNQNGSSGSSSSYKVGTVTANNVNVRTGPGTQYSAVDRYSSGTKVTIYEEQTVGSLRWGRISATRWICLAYVNVTGSTDNGTNRGDESDTVTGRVTGAGTLNVRSGPGTSYTKVGSLGNGTKVTIYQRTTNGGTQWGRIANDRWICMNYVTLDSSNSGTQETGTGTVISTTNLNVRTGAGTNYSLVSRLAPGTSVRILEQTKVSGRWWGRTSQGWVCMDYIRMD